MPPRLRGAIALGLLLAAAPAPCAAADPSFTFGYQTRIVVGVTVSGHIMLSAGLEHMTSRDWSLRGEFLWALAEVPAFGLQGGLTRRWRLDSGSAEAPQDQAHSGALSVGYLRLFAREQSGIWRQLPLWHPSPGLRWGLGDAGALDLELPICWVHQKRQLLPIGLQARWLAADPLFSKSSDHRVAW